MIKNIVSCGCSWVYGTGCKIIGEEKLSALFAKKYNAKDINLAIEGGSNDRIVRKITNWIVENKDRLDETLFLIGVTEPQRFEIWSPYTSNPPFLPEKILRMPNLKIGQPKGKYFREVTVIYNVKMCIEKTLREIFLLTTLFEKYNCKYLIFDSIDNIKKIIRRKNKYFDVVFNNKNYYSKESWLEFCTPRGKGFLAAEDVRMIIREGEDYIPDWGHPSSKGNQKWFEVLSNHVEENKLC